MMKKIGIALAALLWASAAFGQAGSTGVGGFAGGTGYPAGAQPITAVIQTADTTTASAGIPGFPGRLGFICGFSINGVGSTAGGTVSVSVGPLIGTQNQGLAPGTGFSNSMVFPYTFAAGVTTQNAPLTMTFSPCLPASQPNQALQVTVPGQAGNPANGTNIMAWGYTIPVN
jgi:hypothetical protein